MIEPPAQLLPKDVARSDTSAPLPPPSTRGGSSVFSKLSPLVRLPHSKTVPEGSGPFASLRQPLERHGKAWRWLNVVAFWSAACFAIGAAFFITGGITSFMRPVLEEEGVAEWKQRVLVDYAYAIGSCYFTIGAYLSFFEVINTDLIHGTGTGKAPTRYLGGPGDASSPEGYWGSLSYFLGAGSFQAAVTVALFMPSIEPQAALLFEWVPQAVGGALFTVAACFESYHNRGATREQSVYWVCALYLIGSILFLFAASLGTAKSAVGFQSEACVRFGIDLPYLLGSVCFLVGAWAQLQMWKDEQFGLGFISEINRDFVRAGARQSVVEQVALAVYLATGYLSALNFCLSYVWHVHASFEWPSRPGHAAIWESLCECPAATRLHAWPHTLGRTRLAARAWPHALGRTRLAARACLGRWAGRE